MLKDLKKKSIREVAEDYCMDKKTVLRWMKEYVLLLLKFLMERTLKHCNTLHMDELFIRMGKSYYYLFDSLDKQSRFAVLYLSSFRDAEHAFKLVKLSPLANEIITDELVSYHKALLKYFSSNPGEYFRRHKVCKAELKWLNNPVERFQSTLRRFLYFS